MEETGECGEQELNHSDGQAEKFYRDLKQRGISVRIGMEATGYSRWFERLLAESGFELWIGDPAEIKAKRVKKLKYDRYDARLLRRLMLENNFPRIWVPDPENRDLRQLLWHRHRLVQMRMRIMNQLQALAMNEGYRWKKKLFSEQGRAQSEKLALAPWASRRRQELLELLDRMNPTIEELTAAVEREARKRPEVQRLMMHPGVGPLTALALPDKASWLAGYLHELTTFPKGKYDDQADSISQALDWFKNHSTRKELGLVEYLKKEGERMMAAQQSAKIPESRPCSGCNGVMSQRIAGGLRCMQCGAQWPPPGTQQRAQYPTRTDILNGVKFGRF